MPSPGYPPVCAVRRGQGKPYPYNAPLRPPRGLAQDSAQPEADNALLARKEIIGSEVESIASGVDLNRGIAVAQLLGALCVFEA